MIDIRFNNNYLSSKSKYEWRVIQNGVENLVNHVHIRSHSYTTTKFIEGEGQKYHITAFSDSLEIITEVHEGVELKIAYIN